MIKMKTFAGPSLAEAEKAAADWWASQSGLERLSEFATPITTGQRSGGNRWKVTVVFVHTDLPDPDWA